MQGWEFITMKTGLIPESPVWSMTGAMHLLQDQGGGIAGGDVCEHKVFPHQRHYLGFGGEYQEYCGGDDQEV